jgi:hypothetical protein
MPRKRYAAESEGGPAREIERGASGHVDAVYVQDRMYEVIERCLQLKKVEEPSGLSNEEILPCAEARNEDCACESCEKNRTLLERWREFGGVYKFDPANAVKALHLTGRDFGLYYEKKLTGSLEGDEIVDAATDEELRALVRNLASQVGLRVVEQMKRDEMREFIFDHAPGVGLRVIDLEEGREGASGTDPESHPDVQTVS